ncbi:rhamnulokinase family protein [Actinosynnema sp. NPDC002837]
MTVRVAAVDLGATSGRVMVGTVGEGRLVLEEAHRFPNGPVRVAGRRGSTLHWDVLGLYAQTLEGLRAAHAQAPLDAIGIDSWAVDYGLLAADGTLLGNPVHYRDDRTDGVLDQVRRVVPDRDLYATTGLQRLPFNTLYQLVSEREGPRLRHAATMLMVPDLLAYWLTGQIGAEHTNASTTQLYDVRARAWAGGLADAVGVPRGLFPPLRSAGDVIGPVLPEVADESGLPTLPVIAVGSHDTASAVVGVPAEPGTNFAYISSGTWSLVGVELDAPVLSDAARAANFTNEVGVDGKIRFLRNVMGLWVLSESVRTWRAHGQEVDLPNLLAQAAEVPALRAVVDINAPEFLPPGDMPARIANACRQTGQEPPVTRAELVRCVLDSLALEYRRVVRKAAELTGRPIEVVHVVGGGARNELLCQSTADACGIPVVAGPVEATALGNVVVQARALGVELLDLATMRALIRSSHPVRRYTPSARAALWEETRVP